MQDVKEIVEILRSTLQLGRRADNFKAETPLLGHVPEVDSMAVVAILTAIEDQYGISIDDDEMSAEVFATVGSLSKFVQAKLGQ
ncbi:MAG: phosphopantetheine-binding protein [Gammaproteobacteria bacterium]